VRKLAIYLERIQRTFGAFLLIALLITISLQVISRFIIKAPIQWTEEGGRFIFFWVALMGAGVSVQTRKHFMIEVYDIRRIKTPFIRLFLEILPEIIVLMFCILLTYYGWLYFESGKTRMGIEVPLRMSWVYAALPVSGFTMVIYTLSNIFTSVTKILGSPGKHGTEKHDSRE
jgi:TRAP-type C4-dicarboxylate transport system permease small subunit